ncbi:MAG: hypothetical protein JSV22_06600 [Bacteroidales bacterium]|nr:MAG: hypothetical protein JSV22_06600 [Bacteroidales bacterium]
MLLSQETNIIEYEYNICAGYIQISGTSNINNFKLTSSLSPVNLNDSINKKTINNESPVIELQIPIKKFRTSNPLIYKDFIKLLNAESYPFIIIGINYQTLNNIFQKSLKKYFQLEITLTGVTQRYKVAYETSRCYDEYIFIQGLKNIKLSDFNLEPPEKLKGLIKVNNNLLINFGFLYNCNDNLNFAKIESKY